MTTAIDQRPSNALRRHREAILAACQAAGVSNVRVYGSAARGEDRAGSDIDLLVDAPPSFGLWEIAGLQADLVDLTGVEVDVKVASDIDGWLAVAIKPDIRSI